MHQEHLHSPPVSREGLNTLLSKPEFSLVASVVAMAGLPPSLGSSVENRPPAGPAKHRTVPALKPRAALDDDPLSLKDSWSLTDSFRSLGGRKPRQSSFTAGSPRMVAHDVNDSDDTKPFQALASEGGRVSVDSARAKIALNRCMQRAGRLLKKLREIERLVDMNRVKQRIMDGQFFFRGFDKEKRPIVWMKSFRGIRGLSKIEFGEFYLPFIWVLLWALGQRPGETEQVRLVMVDDESRNGLDFNLELMSSFGILLKRLSQVLPVVGPFTILTTRTGLSLSVRTLRANVSSEWRKFITVEKNRDRLHHVVADPADVPKSFIDSNGSSMELGYAELGRYNILLGGKCFARMQPAMFCFPCKSMFPWGTDDGMADLLGEPQSFSPPLPRSPVSPGKRSKTSPTGSLRTGAKEHPLAEEELEDELSPRQVSSGLSIISEAIEDSDDSSDW